MAELEAKRGIDTGSSLENLGHHTRAVCLLRDYRQGDRDYDGRGRRQDGGTHRVAAVEHSLEWVLRNSGGRDVLRAAVGEGWRGHRANRGRVRLIAFVNRSWGQRAASAWKICLRATCRKAVR